MTARTRWGTAAVIALALAGSPATGEIADRRPTTHAIVIEGMAFHPDSVVTLPGDTVRWVNRDLVPHTATAKPAWDTGMIAAGDSAVVVPKRPGRYRYTCAFHPVMKGLLIVK